MKVWEFSIHFCISWIWTRIFVAQYDKDDGYREPLLVWIKPSKESLRFLEICLNSLTIGKVKKNRIFSSKIFTKIHFQITSIGCGCGFYEWLIEKVTKIKVRGLEVNSGWWECCHSTPHYIHLDYTEPGKLSLKVLHIHLSVYFK